MVRQRQHWKFAGSTRVEQAWWDPESRIVEVEFVDGVRWNYLGVGEFEWKKFKAAASAGRYVAQVLDKKVNRPS